MALWGLYFIALAQATASGYVARIPAGSVPSTINLAVAATGSLPGRDVTVPILLTNAGTLLPSALQADLAFDPQVLTFVSARGVAGLQSTAISNGVIRLSVAGAPDSIRNGRVALVTFTLGLNFTGSTALSLSNCWSSAPGVPLSTGCTGGNIGTYSCDIDGDGDPVEDLRDALGQALGMAPAGANLDHDGVLSVTDIQKLINAAIGLGCPY